MQSPVVADSNSKFSFSYTRFKLPPAAPELPVIITETLIASPTFFPSDSAIILEYANGKPYAHKLALENFSVAAFVAPTPGREYEESQKIRAETTYKISTRYFRGINSTHRILYNNREFEIVSVLDLNERHEELQIIAAERNAQTAQNFDKGEYNGEE